MVVSRSSTLIQPQQFEVEILITKYVSSEMHIALENITNFLVRQDNPRPFLLMGYEIGTTSLLSVVKTKDLIPLAC